MNLARDVSWNNAVEPLPPRQRAREGYSFLFFRPSSGGKGAVMEVVYLGADARFRHRLSPVRPVSAAIARAELRVRVPAPGFVGRGRPCLPFHTTLNQNRGNVQK